MRQTIHREIARFGVPGAAVAVVQDGQVVLSDGFGRRDAEAPAGPGTLYMLASDTKCFTATTLCLLAEDGRLDLDAPVRDVLPDFAMHDDAVSGVVTTRDLLTHRTGLPRHDLLTVGDGDFRTSNEDVTRRVRHLEASRPFRSGFGYNNAHYAVAGRVVEVLTGQPWREFLADRVLRPVGMASSGTYLPELTKGDFAAPHVAGVQRPFQTREYDLPGGGMVTCADDLGRWLLARLGRGPLSPALLEELHSPVIRSNEELPFPELEQRGYALGNLAFTYRGQRMQVHGGSQIGYCSQVVVLPEAQVGVAVLTNAHSTLLPLALALTLVDDLLGVAPAPWGERLHREPAAVAPVPPAVPAPRPLPSYAGTFSHPAYGEVGLSVRDGVLVPSFHGLDDELVLTHVGDDAWRLDVTTVPGFSVPLAFLTGDDGTVTGVTLRLEPELAPLRFERC